MHEKSMHRRVGRHACCRYLFNYICQLAGSVVAVSRSHCRGVIRKGPQWLDKRRPQVKMKNKLSSVAILLASAAVGTQAQDMCSCSPTVFNFVLDFSNDKCAVDTITGNPGIKMTKCFQEEPDAVPGQPASRLLSLEHDGDEPRSLQTVDKLVEVVSAQFLEFDTGVDMTVIHQDDTYSTTSLMDGGAMQFYSVSSKLDTSVPLVDQMGDPDLVPGGASLIMYGKTESGKVVRNRFFWLYEMSNCGRENNPVQVGDQIGWVKVVSIS